MAVKTKLLTYADYLALPEIKQRYEIIDGELIMTVAPNVKHQMVSGNLYSQLRPSIEKRSLGLLLYAPVDVIIQRDPLRTRQPDLLFVRAARSEIIRDQIEGAPDIVIEILSPSNSRTDILDKLADYAKIGVPECWIVAPQGATVEVLVLAQGQYQRFGLFGLGNKIKSSVLSELDLMPDEIFKWH